MTFAVSEETKALRKTLRQFVAKEVIPLERENGLTWDVPAAQGSDMQRLTVAGRVLKEVKG